MIELLVCLALIGIIATVGVPRLLDLNGQRLRTAARTLSADLRFLKSQAIRQQHPTSLSATFFCHRISRGFVPKVSHSRYGLRCKICSG